MLSTHIVSDIEYIANEIWLMKDGRIIQQGTLDQMLSSMPEQVWVGHVEKQRVSGLISQYKISNMKAEGNAVELRIISREQPLPGAVCVQPTLEDVFLHYFGEKAGDGDVKI